MADGSAGANQQRASIEQQLRVAGTCEDFNTEMQQRLDQFNLQVQELTASYLKSPTVVAALRQIADRVATCKVQLRNSMTEVTGAFRKSAQVYGASNQENEAELTQVAGTFEYSIGRS